ncbi:hypothetical protein ABK040_006396 [Willaertia magna]
MFIRLTLVFVIFILFYRGDVIDTINTSSVEETWNFEEEIIFAQSGPLSGPSNSLGIELRDGILAAFHEANLLGGIWNSKKLRLVTLDDKYEPIYTKQNTNYFLFNKTLPNGSPGGVSLNQPITKVFGLIGYVGTPTVDSVFKDVISSKVPLIGSFTGARWLRTPFYKNVINLRASYDDETAAMIDWLVNEQLITKISILYQNDSFGNAGLEGVLRALDHVKIPLSSFGLYTRNTLNVEDAVTSIGRANPKAIIMIGTAAPVAKFVKLVRDFSLQPKNERQGYKEEEIIFLTVSFVGSAALSKQLHSYSIQSNGTMDYTKNVVITQVVPSPFDESFPLVQSYQRARKSYILSNGGDVSKFVPSFIELEGYLVGKFTYMALSQTTKSLTRTNFINTVYASGSRDKSAGDLNGKIFIFDAMKVGPFRDCDTFDPLDELMLINNSRPFLCNSTTYNCNQGLKSVYKSQISGSSFKIFGFTFSWYSPGGSFSTCISDISTMRTPPISNNRELLLLIIIPVSVTVLLIIIALISYYSYRYYRQRKEIENAPKSGDISIAFTDILNSSTLWQTFEKSMKEALLIHNAIMRKNLKNFDGYEVKTNGDSFYVAFRNPADCIDWAVSVQHDLNKAKWPSELYNAWDCRQVWDEETRNLIWSGLRVRIGIHFGRAENQFDKVMKRPDYFGSAINKAARIESIAGGGQILVSEEFLLETWKRYRTRLYSYIYLLDDNPKDYVRDITATFSNCLPSSSFISTNSGNVDSISSVVSVSRSSDNNSNPEKKQKRKIALLYTAEDLGKHYLKGLQGLSRVFQIKSKEMQKRQYPPIQNNFTDASLDLMNTMDLNHQDQDHSPIGAVKFKKNYIVPIDNL